MATMTNGGSRTDDALMFALGHYVGAFHPRVGSTDRFHTIRIGADVPRLSDEELAVWLMARGTPEPDDEQLWNRSAVAALAREANIDNPEKLLAGLDAKGVIVEVHPGTNQAVAFAEAYQVVPLMLGLGNTPDEPGLQGIGFFGQPILKVTSQVYAMWEWCHVDDSLWAGCHAYTEVARQAGVTDADELDPEQVLNGFLTALHPLLVANAAYLDLARE